MEGVRLSIKFQQGRVVQDDLLSYHSHEDRVTAILKIWKNFKTRALKDIGIIRQFCEM